MYVGIATYTYELIYCAHTPSWSPVVPLIINNHLLVAITSLRELKITPWSYSYKLAISYPFLILCLQKAVIS